MIEDLYMIEAIRKAIEERYRTPLYIINANKRFSWKILISTIPQKEIFKDPRNVFKLLFKGGRAKNFMETINNVFEPDAILFYSKDYPLGSNAPIIEVDRKKVLCINYIMAQKLLSILSERPFLEFIQRQYPNVPLERLGLKQEDVDILKKETPIPQKNIIRRIGDHFFPQRGEDILKVNLSQLSTNEKEDFIKNFTKVINSQEEIKRKTAILKELRHLMNTDSLEEDFQEIIEENPWIFGEEYFSCQSSRTKIGGRSIPDLKVKDMFNRSGLIIELKRAIKTEKKDSRLPDQIAPNAHILDALWQGIRYLEEQIKKGKYGVVYIVIGKGDKDVRKMLTRINAHIHNIHFMTYEEIIDRAEARIRSYKPIGLNRIIAFLKKYT